MSIENIKYCDVIFELKQGKDCLYPSECQRKVLVVLRSKRFLTGCWFCKNWNKQRVPSLIPSTTTTPIWCRLSSSLRHRLVVIYIWVLRSNRLCYRDCCWCWKVCNLLKTEDNVTIPSSPVSGRCQVESIIVDCTNHIDVGAVGGGSRWGCVGRRSYLGWETLSATYLTFQLIDGLILIHYLSNIHFQNERNHTWNVCISNKIAEEEFHEDVRIKLLQRRQQQHRLTIARVVDWRIGRFVCCHVTV